MEELAFDARRVMRDARGVSFRHRGCEGEDKGKEQETHREPEKLRLVHVFSCGRARSAWKRLCVGRCFKANVFGVRRSVCVACRPKCVVLGVSGKEPLRFRLFVWCQWFGRCAQVSVLNTSFVLLGAWRVMLGACG